jgi:hypothetical protein
MSERQRPIAFVGFVRLSGLFGLERVEVAHAVVANTAVKLGESRLRGKKLASDGQLIIEGQKKHLSKFNHDYFL